MLIFTATSFINLTFLTKSSEVTCVVVVQETRTILLVQRWVSTVYLAAGGHLLIILGLLDMIFSDSDSEMEWK